MRRQKRFTYTVITAISTVSLLMPLIASNAAAVPSANKAASDPVTTSAAGKVSSVVNPVDLAARKTMAAVASKPVIAKQTKLLPVDEASKNPDFKKFRDQLITAVKNKDLNFIKSHLDKNIKNGFSGNDGATEFFKQWKLNRHPEKSPLWYELGEVLRRNHRQKCKSSR
jgi:hypothetical protein